MDRMVKSESYGSRARFGKKADPLGTNTEIARKLKQYYDDLVNEEIPDRFADLLSKLEQAEQPRAEE